MRVTRKIFNKAAANLFSLIDFPKILSSLVSFAFLIFFFLLLLFFEIKNVYSDTYSTMRAGE